MMESSQIEVLPDDMLTSIFEFLKPKELARITKVCKKWLLLIRGNVRLYKRFVLNVVNLPVQLNLLEELKLKYALPSFTPKSSCFEVCSNGKKATKFWNDAHWKSIFVEEELKRGSKNSFKISSRFTMIGLAPKEVDQSLSSHWLQPGGGWYLACFKGNLYCRDLDFVNKPYHRWDIPEGSIVSVELSESGDIVFYENGVSLGVAFSNITQPVIPAVLMCGNYCPVEIVHNPK